MQVLLVLIVVAANHVLADLDSSRVGFRLSKSLKASTGAERKLLSLRGGSEINSKVLSSREDTKTPEQHFSNFPSDIKPGLVFHDDGETSFRVWAPHASTAIFQIQDNDKIIELPLNRDGDTWTARFSKNVVISGTQYRLALSKEDGTLLLRRDPYARQADYNSSWCFADNAQTYPWTDSAAYPRTFPPAFDEYVIYELHVGSFTPQGTLQAATSKLEHISKLGFTAIQLMPLTEFSDAWGYNPRQLMSVHGPYGTPEDLRNLVDTAHKCDSPCPPMVFPPRGSKSPE